MIKKLLDRNIGKLVNISLIDGQIVMGQLCYCAEYHDKKGWIRPAHYFIGDISFIADNVRTLELI